jgi:hypothetical protein
MLKCWNYSPEQRPTFRYSLEILKALKSRTNQYAKITAQFTADAFKYWSSTTTDSSNSKHVFRPIQVEASNGCAIPKATPVPKYLELMYDDSQDENSSGQSISIEGKPQMPQGMIRTSHPIIPTIKQSPTQQDGYEIPLNFDNDSNNNFKIPVSRSHSNSSTLPSVDPEEIRISLEKTLNSNSNRNSHPLSLDISPTKHFLNNGLSNENLIQHNVV